MVENPYLSKDVPLLLANILEGSKGDNQDVQIRLNEFQRIIAETSHIKYQADPLLPMSSSEYHQLYVNDYLMHIEANIYENVSQNLDCRFILLHYDFIFNHFFKIVSKFPVNREPGLVVDTIIEQIYDHYKNGLSVDFERYPDRYGAAPQGIFSSQDEILGFYNSVKRLYEGDPDRYMVFVGKYLFN